MRTRAGRNLLLALAIVAGVLAPLAAARSHTPTPPAPRGEALPPGLAPVVAATLAPPDYHVAPGAAGGWRADNPAQGMAVDFTADGPRVSPGAGGDLRLTLARLGRAGSLTAPEPARMEAAGARIDYRRGAVTEWYVNDHRGVEQGFTLDAAPAGDAGAPLVVELAPTGGLRPALDATGSSIRFTSPTGGALNYGGLAAWDATGRVLPSRLGLTGDMVTLTVDDAGAAYPVVIDPLVNVHEAWLTPSDGSETSFGYSVGISGNTAVVGSLGTDSAYVFVRSGGTWSEQARLRRGVQPNYGYGFSVAIDGDTIVVGAWKDDTAAFDAGSAFVYARQAGVWTEQAHLVAPNPVRNGRFGWAVAVSGDTVLVGGHAQSLIPDQAVQTRQANIFVRSGSTWMHQATLAVESSLQSVALSGDTAVLGQPVGLDLGGGSAFVFVRSGGTWSRQAELTPSDGDRDDAFGYTVGVSGGTVVVGAGRHKDSAGNVVGSAYVFVPAGASWVEQARLVPADLQPGEAYGFSVAISGNLAVVGAYAGDAAGAAGAGATYAFRRTGTTWGPAARYTAPNADTSDQLGFSVAISGSTALAGATLRGIPGGLGSGGAAVFTIIPVASLVLTPPAATVATGSPQSYTVSGLDATGHDMGDFTSSTTFSITPNGSCTGATCTPAAPGAHTVSAALDGLTATASLTATSVDTTPPVIAVPAPISVPATGPSGAVVTYSATATDGAPANPAVSCSPPSGSTFPVGTTTVRCTSTDAAGNTGTASFTVSVAGAVVDNVPPVLTLPAPITATSSGSSGGAVVNYPVSASDNDPAHPNPAVTCTPASGSTFPIGVTTVTCTSTDTSGNTATSTFTVTIRDIRPPEVTVPAPITVDPTGPAGAPVTFTATASDDDARNPSPAVTCTPASGSTFPIGATTVTCKATDPSGHTTTESFPVTVQDKVPPVLTLPAPITATSSGSSGGAVVTFTATASDNDPAHPSAAVTCTPASGSTFPIGVSTVSCTSTDASGNTATDTFTVSIQDVLPPVVSVPAAVTADAVGPGAAVTFTATASDDDARNPSPAVTCTPASGSTFPIGATTVTCKATDPSGHTTTESFPVTVQDKVPPVLTLPAPITATSSGSTGGAVVNYPVGGSDNDPAQPHPAVTCTPASGSTFPIGVTTVTCTSTDASGNTATDTFTVTIHDVLPPVVSVPAPVTADAVGAGAVVTFTAAASDDDARNPSPAVTCTPASGSPFPIGATTVTCKATDQSGSSGTNTFTLTVRDVTPPAIAVPTPVSADSVGTSGGAVVNYPVSASDNDPAQPNPVVTCTPASGSTFPIGVTTVSCTSTDASGNTATNTFTVTIHDVLPPVVSVPAPVTADAVGPGAVVSFTAAASDDDARNPSPAVTCTPASGSTFPIGATTVTCKATDQSANAATNTFTVTVRDVTPPAIAVPTPVSADSVGTSGGAVVNYPVSASDNDPAQPNPAVTCTPASGSTFPIGVTTVSCTSTDASGNTATDKFTVSIQDVLPPVVSVPAPVTADAVGGGATVTFTATASDDDARNPSPAVTCTPASGSTFPIGATTVTCKATDQSANAATNTFTVTVRDVTPPAITVPAPVSANSVGTSGGAVVNYPVSATDNDARRPNPAVTCTPASGSTFPIGVTTVTCTSTDLSGNTATSTFTVTIRDILPPVVTVPAPITVDPTGPAGAPVTFTASAKDDDRRNPTPAVTCTPASGTTFPIARTTTVVCKASDVSDNTTTTTFTVTVRSPLDLFARLIQLSTGTGPGKDLQSKAEKARDRYVGGDLQSSCKTLDDYLKQVEIHTPKQVSSATAAALTDLANLIRLVIGC